GLSHNTSQFIALKKGDIFVDKIDPCLHMGQYCQKRVPSLLHLTREITPQMALRNAQSNRGCGPDGIEHCFRLGEIQASVEKGPLRKLSRFRHSRTRLNTSLAHHLKHQRSAMRLNFDYVLCRKRPRSLHVDHERLIEQARPQGADMNDSRLSLLIRCGIH